MPHGMIETPHGVNFSFLSFLQVIAPSTLDYYADATNGLAAMHIDVSEKN